MLSLFLSSPLAPSRCISFALSVPTDGILGVLPRHRLLVIAATNGNFVVIIRTARGRAGVAVERNRVFTLSRSHSRTAEKLVPRELGVCNSARLWFSTSGLLEEKVLM